MKNKTSQPDGTSAWTPAHLVRAAVLEMHAYTPILPYEVLSAQLGCAPEDILKLDANENLYGAVPEARAALAALPYPHIYPDPESRALRSVLAQHTGVPAAQLVAGAGADELIDLTMRMLLDAGDVLLDCQPTFGMYANCAHIQGARVVAVPRRADFALDMPALHAAVAQHKPKLLCLGSPNNPDGSQLPDADLLQLLQLPLVLLLDEAYIDFAGAGASRITWPLRHTNLVVLRTFSKSAGLAGLRAGYGAFPAALVEHVWKIKPPYNLSVAADAAARAALAAMPAVQAHVDAIVAERARLAAGLAQVPYLQPIPSAANFVLCRVTGRPAQQLQAQLAQQRILVRYFDKPALRDCVRISVGQPAHTDRLLQALHALPAA